MPTGSSVSLKNLREKRNLYAEVSDSEKKLWARIHSEGLLGTDVKDLYSKACCIYKKLFLSDNELPDLQNIEYLLWRLHYKHIDEFRKRISQSLAKEVHKLSTNENVVASRRDTVDEHMKGFKLFLSEATKFYQELIRLIKRYYGLLDEPWFYKNERVSGRTEKTKLHKCQFICHRLCICLGDLARYLEVYEKPDNQQRNWSIAANYYLEAAKIYPDGGNPQNQLAVLATYIGDEFLALYHCIRSLAVKEPFPDALRNLMLLFERNRSSDIGSLSTEVYDFNKPSEWISTMSNGTANGVSSNKTTLKSADRDRSLPTDVWSLIIRTTSFFFLESSLDSFLCTFTSTLRDLEALLAQDVMKLSSALESYKNVNLSKAGPYRALHLISVLLFIIHNLHGDPEHKILKPTNETQQSTLVNLALTVTFICMGRLVDRCLKGSPVVYFPLLPALLVFVEWLVDALEKIDAGNEKCESAMCYFFRSFVELLNYLQEKRAQVTFPGHIALWEDYELRGFVPLSHTHELLDFSSHWEEEINYKMKNEYRAHRIVQAAIKIAKRSSFTARKWLFYSEVEKKFTMQAKETSQQINSGMLTVIEEEEDIVFKPIARHNSEPIPPMDGQAIASASDERLRRASSLLVAQNRAFTDSLTLPESPIAAGPPSLSSWVLNGEKLSSERAKSSEIDRSVLQPIEETRPLSLLNDESSSVFSSVTSPSTNCLPVPSAPLLPENGVWFTGTSAGFSLGNSATHETTSCFFPDSRASVSSNPLNVHQEQHHAPRSLDGVNGSEVSRFDHLDGWSYSNYSLGSFPPMYLGGTPPLLPPSSPLLRGLYDQRKHMLFQDYQRPSPYVFGAMTNTRPEPQPEPLLQYFKQREWQPQQQLPFTGSPYMQN